MTPAARPDRSGTDDEPAAVYAWRRLDDSPGHSAARVEHGSWGRLFHGSEVVGPPDGPLACWFTVTVDRAWLTRAAVVGTFSAAGSRDLWLDADSDRRWDVDGVHAPELDGCVDVDVAATPLTNTFPIRRLHGLEVGQAVTSPVAWVEVPSLRVLRVEQTYRRLGPLRWEYGDPTHGTFVIDVDPDGVVLDYQGFAVRV